MRFDQHIEPDPRGLLDPAEQPLARERAAPDQCRVARARLPEERHQRDRGGACRSQIGKAFAGLRAAERRGWVLNHVYADLHDPRFRGERRRKQAR